MVFNLKQQQLDFIGASQQFAAYVGGIGTGKSSSLIIKALAHAQESPGNLGIIVRKNFTDLRDSTIADYEKYTGRHVSHSEKEDTLPNGSKILFRHGDELPVLKNINAGFAAIEQAEEFPDETVWEFLKMRIRRECKHRTLFLVANANGHNWIWSMFKRNGCPPNHILVEAKTQDFSDILPADYIKNLESLPKKLYNRYVLNSWEQTEGLVYDEYESSKHQISAIDLPDTWEKGFVLDHGLRNPTAILWYAIDFDGNIYLYDEHYEKEKPISYHAEMIKHRFIFTGYCDPSIFSMTQSKGNRTYSIADEYRELGIELRPAYRSQEQASIARVNEFFKDGKIKVFKNLVHFEKEITSWKWKEVRPTAANLNLPEVPEDKDNHLMDCLKYLIASRFPATDKPEEKPNKRSLEWFDKQQQYEQEAHERENARRFF